ncbi:MAG: alpha/beta fold hydrolase [Kiritimatiellae bacterium]|nr:alpha/beta fold hydrolase [Kiritimatiellia bacterium]
MARLYAETEGSGPDVVFLHGLLGSVENWKHIQSQLADRYRVTCIDLPNHGRSPQQPAFTMRSMADDVAETLATADIKSAAIVGHSLGGKVAMVLATEYTELCNALVVVDMTIKRFAPVHLFVLRACRDLPLEKCSRRADLKEQLMHLIALDQTCDFALKNVVRDDSGAFTWRIPLDYLIDNATVVSDAVPLVSPYEGPTAFILGGDSPFRVWRDADAIKGWFPAAKFVTVPGAGHLVHTDQPEAFLRELETFLSNLNP